MHRRTDADTVAAVEMSSSSQAMASKMKFSCFIGCQIVFPTLPEI